MGRDLTLYPIDPQQLPDYWVATARLPLCGSWKGFVPPIADAHPAPVDDTVYLFDVAGFPVLPFRTDSYGEPLTWVFAVDLQKLSISDWRLVLDIERQWISVKLLAPDIPVVLLWH